MQCALAAGSRAVEHGPTHRHGSRPDASTAPTDADVASALQAEREGKQAVQEAMQSNQDGSMQARQSPQHQPGLFLSKVTL